MPRPFSAPPNRPARRTRWSKSSPRSAPCSSSFPSSKRCSPRRWFRPEEKSQMLDRLFGSKLSPTGARFSQSGRAARPARHRAGRSSRKSRNSTTSCAAGCACNCARPRRWTTAFRGACGRRWRNFLAASPSCDPTVDPALIGGIVLRVGDTVYDGSVARQLDQVREQMINRSVHEIQSRRDRFRHSGGN